MKSQDKPNDAAEEVIAILTEYLMMRPTFPDPHWCDRTWLACDRLASGHARHLSTFELLLLQSIKALLDGISEPQSPGYED